MHVNAHSVTVKVVSRAFSFEYICEVDGAPIDAHDDAEVNGAERVWHINDEEGDHHEVSELQLWLAALKLNILGRLHWSTGRGGGRCWWMGK